MLGADVNWVRKVQPAAGDVTLPRRREEVHLDEVAVDLRAPIISAYLNRAPGARLHVPVDKKAALAEFETPGAQRPLLRVVAR